MGFAVRRIAKYDARMAKWKKQSHVVYQCSYHIVWCPKYRLRILEGDVGKYVEGRIRAIAEWKHVEIEELAVMKDHVHLVVNVPPRVSSVVALDPSSTYLKAPRQIKSYFLFLVFLLQIQYGSPHIVTGFAGLISSPSSRHDDVPKGCRNHFSSLSNGSVEVRAYPFVDETTILRGSL